QPELAGRMTGGINQLLLSFFPRCCRGFFCSRFGCGARLGGFGFHHRGVLAAVDGGFKLYVVRSRRGHLFNESPFHYLALHLFFTCPGPYIAIERAAGVDHVAVAAELMVGIDLLFRVVAETAWPDRLRGRN